ncbi:hypothetical protein AB8O64_28730 [Streptomyces sp. QH1-20]|uniref:hypothetical protein n=1 Tax=Streptomyces sp. QH1-20 TaxID=3240934 RepID=UPI00351211FB
MDAADDEITADLNTRLLRDQHPDLAALPREHRYELTEWSGDDLSRQRRTLSPR